MKKTLLVAALALMLVACGGDKPAETTNAPTATETATPLPVATERKEEHYFVGTTPDMPPFSFKDEHGSITGFEIELLKAIAEDQNFSFDIVPGAFSGLFNDLAKDKYQILVATLGSTPERKEKSEMSKPYVWATNIIMGKEGGTVQTLADIGDSKVAVADQSHTHEALKKAGVKNIIVKDKLYGAYTAFIRGEADYVAGDAGALSHHHVGSGVADSTKVYTAIYNKDDDASASFAVQKGNTVLLEKINTGLANIRANGKYDEIYKKWFGDDQSLKVPADKQ